MYKQVFRYDNVLGYGIVQNKEWDEVLAALGMFCSNSKLCVLFAHYRLHSCGWWSAGQGGAASCLAELVLVPAQDDHWSDDCTVAGAPGQDPQ